jgi:predicted MFS family arabinose efflux permease
LLAMMALGFGEIFGGLFVGKVRDSCNNVAAIVAQLLILLAALIYI